MPVQTQTQNYIQNSIRESLTNANSDENLQNQLISSAKRIFNKSIEYEEVKSYSPSIFNNLKEKYTVLQSNGTTNNTPGQSKSALAEKSTNGSNNGTNGTSNTLPAPKRVLFSRDDIQIGWKSSGRRWQVGSGMMNVGNTCYLNSTLQAIFHVPSMANWLMSDTKHRETCENNGGGQGGCIICAMAKTLISSQSNQSAIKPWPVYTKLRLVCKHLTMGRQEDAHEFLRYLIESMEKLYLGRFKNSKDLEQYSKETTPLNQILGGYLRSAVRCLSCNHVSTTYQHFQDLLLDIRKASSVEEALEGYFSRERLEDMGYKCEACKKRVSATKQFSLERAPIALCIQLKRFSMMGSKLNKHVQIRQRLDLSAYASQSLKKSGDKLNYRLVSMVTHLGSSQNCGHYTAIGMAESGSYYQFDDSCVRSIPVQNVMNTNAYIIFYELEDGSVRSANSSSTTTSSAVFLNENTTGFNGSIKKSQENGSTASSSQNFNNKNGNEACRNTTFNGVSKLDTKPNLIGPQLPPQMAQNREDTANASPTKNGKSNSISLQEYANRKQVGTDDDTFNFNRSLKLTGGNTINGLPAKHDKLVIHFKNTKNDSQLKSPTPNQVTINGLKSPLSVKKSLSFTNNSNGDQEPQLPSMPNLCNGTTETATTTTGNNNKANETELTTPTKSSTITLSPNTKRLVPYDSDESDNEEAGAKHKTNGNGYSTNSSLSNDDIVETNAGLWQVSDSSIKRPSKQGSTTNVSYSTAKEGDTKMGNTSTTLLNRQNGNTATGSTVNQLLKMSQRGYGAPGVCTWNGEKSAMDKELMREKREERKRHANTDDEDDEEMDRGRVKKVKMMNNHYENNSNNNGFNPFQNQQNRQFNNNGNNSSGAMNNGGNRDGWPQRFYNSNNNNSQNQNGKGNFFSHRPNNYNNFNRHNNSNSNFRNNHNNNNKRPFHNNNRHNNNNNNHQRGNFQRRY